jgi:CubicO group peptidase (beta-lactamase class C family)
MTAFLIGIAQRDSILSINDSASHYLGSGWTSCPPDKERLITVLNQLTMTTGLKDLVVNPECTSLGCLVYKADVGTRWAYHTGPYTLLDKVLENASGQIVNIYFNTKIRSRIGMNGLWVPLGYNNVYTSNARSMARFGLLALN